MSEFSNASRAAGSGIDRLNAFTEELHEWSVSGRKPVLASRELRYVLGQQKQRLQSFGLQMENEIGHTGDEITGRLARKGQSINASVLYREAVRRTSIKSGEKTVKTEKEPITFYATLLEKPGFSDFSCTCPNCGHSGLVSEMRDGCPYCGTVFEIEDVWPVFTSWYSVPGIVERATLMPNLKKAMTMIFVGSLAVLSVISWFVNSDMDPIFRVLVSLFTAAVASGMLTFVSYMAYSLLLLGKVFRQAGRSLPLLKGMRTEKKVENIIRKYEPDFSYPYF
ncbi:MAG: TFIIB-type zinc ribbon-containing protein, partial [Erysipelotrichaceae bacterium]|nr:TFIIB-type zinc ribbon-containing protein [Erysipelotrichaceae bacterium]